MFVFLKNLIKFRISKNSLSRLNKELLFNKNWRTGLVLKKLNESSLHLISNRFLFLCLLKHIFKHHLLIIIACRVVFLTMNFEKAISQMGMNQRLPLGVPFATWRKLPLWFGEFSEPASENDMIHY